MDKIKDFRYNMRNFLLRMKRKHHSINFPQYYKFYIDIKDRLLEFSKVSKMH